MKYINTMKTSFLRLSNIERWIVVVILSILSLLVFYGLDSTLGDIKSENGVIYSKKYTAAYTTMQVSTINNVTTTTPVFHPEEFHVSIDVYGHLLRCRTYENQYHKSGNGDKVIITYSEGWITDGKYCKSFGIDKKDDDYT